MNSSYVLAWRRDRMRLSHQGWSPLMKPIPNPDDGVGRVIIDEKWLWLEPILRKILNPRARPPKLTLREFLEAVFFWARTGVG